MLCDDKVVASVTDAQYDERTNETHVSFPRCECSSLELKITGYYGRSPGIRELEVYDVDTGLGVRVVCAVARRAAPTVVAE